MIPTATRCLLLLALATPGLASAASCDLEVPDFAFGRYAPSDPQPTDSSALLEVRCQGDLGAGETVSYSLSIGAGSSGDYQRRAMGGPGDQLSYNLYADGNRSLAIGDGSQGSVTFDGLIELPGRSTASHAVFGRIPPGQQVTAGSYTDQLVIQLIY